MLIVYNSKIQNASATRVTDSHNHSHSLIACDGQCKAILEFLAVVFYLIYSNVQTNLLWNDLQECRQITVHKRSAHRMRSYFLRLSKLENFPEFLVIYRPQAILTVKTILKCLSVQLNCLKCTVRLVTYTLRCDISTFLMRSRLIL
jgi:hypothetical protein